MAKQQSFTYDVVLLNLTESRTSEGSNSGLLLEEALREWGIRTCFTEGECNLYAVNKGIEETRIALVVVTGNDYRASLSRSSLLKGILDYFWRNRLPIFAVYYVDRSQAYQEMSSLYIPSNYELSEMHDEEIRDDKPCLCKQVEADLAHQHILLKAMRHVSDLPGWDFNRNKKNILEFNSHIASQVYQKLNRAPLHVADYPVGLESRLKEVCSLLELTSSNREFLYLGFYGDQGIGKSTLARVVYNSIAHLFEGSCFLHNVRENSNKHGLVRLQNMLLSEIVGEMDIQLENVSEGVSMIKHWLHQKKVLLVLDDVDSLEQLEVLAGKPDWFGPGSKVIIITQDKHLLTFHGIKMLYEVQPLNHKDALELLSHMAFFSLTDSHMAFKHGNVNPRYTEILNQVVTYAFGLPLVLKIIGCYLYEKSVDEWENAISEFKRIPHNDIQRVCKIYDDASKEGDQSIFQKSVLEVYQTFQAVPNLQTSHSVFKAEKMWRLVGLVSSVVGLLCFALSPSFNREFGEWNPSKFFGYLGLSLVICAIVLCAKQTSFSSQRKRYIICYVVFLIISVYSFFYDKAVDGKPGILSLVSNVAFALVSLSLSKLVDAGFDTGTFCYFLGCFTIQLLTINWKLIFVAIIIGCPLFLWHFSSYSRPEDDYRGQTLPVRNPNNQKV